MATKRQQQYIPGLTPRPVDTQPPADKPMNQGKKQPYIPGLNARPDDVEMPPRAPGKSDLQNIIDEFLSETKNPTMCLYEYCTKKKLALQYKQEQVEYKPGMPNMGCYGYRVVINGLAYPKGVASTKQGAKNEACKLAFKVLIGQVDFKPEEIQPEIDDFRFEEVRIVSDLCENRGLLYDKMMTRDKDGQHTCTVTITSLDPIMRTSSNRDEAVVRAHTEAIRILGGSLPVHSVAEQQPARHEINTPNLDGFNEGSRIPDPKLARLRETTTYKALQTSLESLPSEFAIYDHNVAAIFVSNDTCPGYESVGQLVAFGTGNSTIAVESLTVDGRCVIDSTCVVIARRSLKRYLAQQMLFCYENSQPSIFKRRHEDSTRLQLKPGFTFHLYVSHPVDGDYKESLTMPSDLTPEQLEEIKCGSHCPTFIDGQFHGQLRVKNEQGMVELTQQTPYQSSLSDVNLANEMWVMTASDKLLRWNILGLQGAAFTHFTDPIYLSSITLGYHPNSDYGHLMRAVCCRLFNYFADLLPPPYRMNHPAIYIMPTETREQFHLGKASTQDSLNFNCFDKKLELTEGFNGKNHEKSPFHVSVQHISRQCKAGLHLKWFKDLCRQNGGYRLKLFENKSPAEVKAMAETYQEVKEAFLKHCLECDIGKWIHAPPELSTFTK